MGKGIEIDEAGDECRGQIRKTLCITHEEFSKVYSPWRIDWKSYKNRDRKTQEDIN